MSTPVPETVEERRVVFGIGLLNPESSVVRNSTQESSFQYRPEYEHLIGWDPATGAIEPQLATEWEILNGGRLFRFHLREGVQFHRGWGELRAHDVVHTHDLMARVDSLHPRAANWRRDVARVGLTSDRVVEFHLNRPIADFLNAVGEQQGLLPIQSREHFRAHGEPPDANSYFISGTGPYQLVHRRAGTSILFERPEYTHWRVTPDFHEFEFRIVRDPAIRLASLLTGETHIAALPIDLQRQAQNLGMRVSRGPIPTSRVWVNLFCCWQDPITGAYPARPGSPLTNVNVRKALAKAIDRQAIGDAYFEGEATDMYLNHFYPTGLGWNPVWESDFPDQYGYDPEAARSLLSQEGFGPGNRLETTIELIEMAHFPLAWDIGEAVSGFFADVGVRTNLLFRIPEARRAARLAMKDDNLMTVETDDSNLFEGFPFWTTPMINENNASNMPVITDLTARALNTFDVELQDQLWRQIGDLSYANYLSLPLFWFHAEATYNPDFISHYDFPGGNAAKWSYVHSIKAAK